MKERVSATIDKKTFEIIKELLKQGNYRNKSHIIEDAIKLLKQNQK
jgi:Arc/MetJ-type ribon-helix-helix transcriptional regulator